MHCVLHSLQILGGSCGVVQWCQGEHRHLPAKYAFLQLVLVIALGHCNLCFGRQTQVCISIAMCLLLYLPEMIVRRAPVKDKSGKQEASASSI